MSFKVEGCDYYKKNYLPLLGENKADNSSVNTKTTILRKMKNVVLNTRSYNKYLKNYHDLTQISTFKKPEIAVYPVTKNEQMLSLTKRSFCDRSARGNSTLTGATSDRGTKDQEFINYFQGSEVFKTARNISIRRGILSNDYNNDFLSTNSNYDAVKTEPDDFSHRTPIKPFSIDFQINKNLLNKKENSKFSIDKLYDLEHNIKQFDIENEVYKKFKGTDFNYDIKTFLTSKLKELTIGATENVTCTKTKLIQTTNYNLNLTINSLKLTIKQKNPEEDNLKEMILLLPFSLLPLYYFTNDHYFKVVLSQVLKFSENLEKVEIDITSLQTILEKFKIQIYNNSILREDSNVLLKNSYLHLNTIDIISHSKVFEMTIQHPKIEFTIDQVSTGKTLSFTKYIDKEVLIHILRHNFIKWDFYTLNYLSRYKLFRDNLVQFVNFRKNQTGNFNNNLPVKKVDLDGIRNHVYEYNLHTQRTHDMILLIPFNEMIVNLYQKIFPHSVEITVDHFYNRDFHFNLNFGHMICLERIKEFWTNEEFIKKCLTVHYQHETVEINWKCFETIDEDYINYLMVSKRANPVQEVKSARVEREDPVCIKVHKPSITWTGFVRTLEGLIPKQITFTIPEDMLNTLVLNDVHKWSNTFSQFTDELTQIFNSDGEKKVQEQPIKKKRSFLKRSLTKFSGSHNCLNTIMERKGSFVRKSSARFSTSSKVEI